MPPSGDYGETDERVLAYLDEEGADYPALIAGNTGLHVSLVERRCDALAEAGLVEPVSGETVYRLTDRGETYLEEPLGAASD